MNRKRLLAPVDDQCTRRDLSRSQATRAADRHRLGILSGHHLQQRRQEIQMDMHVGELVQSGRLPRAPRGDLPAGRPRARLRAPSPRQRTRSRHTFVAATALAFAIGPVAAQQAGDLELEPFTFVASNGSEVEAESGTLWVQENRENGDSELIALALIKLPSTATNPGPPIIFLAGGPGGSGIETAGGSLFRFLDAMREFGDVIALDQRGSGASRPSLLCKKKHSVMFPLNEALTFEGVETAFLKKARSCAKKLRKRDIDIDAYNTRESADDLDDLREALGADQIVLWGSSYGTHLALAAIKRHEARISKAILHGVQGPDHVRSLPKDVENDFKTFAKAMTADAAVEAVLPSPFATLKEVIRELEQNGPRAASFVHPLTGESTEVTFGAIDVQHLFADAQDLDDFTFIRLMPRLIFQASQGDYSEMAFYLALAGGRLLPFRLDGMPLSMICASGASKGRLKKIARQENNAIFGRTLDLPVSEVCEAWGVADLGKTFRKSVKSDLRTLLISGTLDS